MIADALEQLSYQAEIFEGNVAARVKEVLLDQGVASTTADTAGWVMAKVISWGAF